MERKPFGRVNVTPACAGLGSLVDDLLEQIGAGLGECELAEARIDGSEVGVDNLVESVVLHDVSFRLAWRRSCFLFFPLAAAVSLVCFSVISARVALPFPRVWGAAPVFSPVPAASCLFVLLCLHHRQAQPSMSCNDRRFFCIFIG